MDHEEDLLRKIELLVRRVVLAESRVGKRLPFEQRDGVISRDEVHMAMAVMQMPFVPVPVIIQELRAPERTERLVVQPRQDLQFLQLFIRKVMERMIRHMPRDEPRVRPAQIALLRIQVDPPVRALEQDVRPELGVISPERSVNASVYDAGLE